MSSTEKVSFSKNGFQTRRESNKVRFNMRRSTSESSMLNAEVCMTPDNNKKGIKEFEDSSLYTKVRNSLHKVNRVSKSQLPQPSTPSKPGVYEETCIGKFAQIKSLFDRRCRNTADRPPRSKPDLTRDSMKIANSIFRKFAKNINYKEPKPRRLYDSESSTPERVTFNSQKETIEI